MGSQNSHSRAHHVMENLLKYEEQVKTFLHEGSPPGVLPFPNSLERASPEAELWSRVHLSYAKSLNSGGYSDTAAIDQWVDTRTALLMEYVPRRIWSLSQTKLKELKQKLILQTQSCQYELDFQLSDSNEVITPLTLFCKAFLCSACKDKELFNQKLLPSDVTWPDFVAKYYSPIWREGMDLACTKVTNENLLPTALHVLSEVSIMYKYFVKLSANQEDSLSWLHELPQLKTICSCCEDVISSYFDNTCQLQLCQDLDQMLSTERVSSVTQQVDNCIHGGKVVIQSCWRLCNDMDRVMMVLNGRCPLTEHLQSLCSDTIHHATSAWLQKLSEWCSTDTPQRLPYRSWYIILSSLLYMSGRLRHHVMHNAAYCLTTPLQECGKLVDRVQLDIVNYHVELCRSGLLHDGRSHHWQDSRPFHEGERCSFAIQMWAYHLKAFKHDLWQVFAYDVAAKLLGAVLAEGLIILSQRYNGVKPSMRRLPQMKADILMVLLTSASLLPHIFPLPCQHIHHLYVTSCVINSCCMSLLCDLTLVCADLRTIMDAVMENTMTTNGLRRGFNDYNSEWLGHVLAHCHMDLPVTYTMGASSCAADAANNLLHLCALSTLKEQLLIKVLVVNDFLFSKGLIKGGADVLSELAHVLCHCSHTPSGLCVVLQQAGNKECTDWLRSYLQPHLLQCMLPQAVLFTRWMAKFLHSEVAVDDVDDRNTLVGILSETLKEINTLLLLLPSPVCLLISRLSPVSTLLGMLLRSAFPQSHDQLFYTFVSILAGLLDGSMVFEAPASIVDVLSLCKADFVPIVTTLNDASLVTNDIYSDVISDDSEHMVVATLLKETSIGKRSLEILFNTIISNQDALLQWCKREDPACDLLPLSAPPTCRNVKPFCPTTEFCQIGQVTLDHTALLKPSLDWPDLLTVVWPQLSKEMLTDRLGNRWEFQDGAQLDDEECQLVDDIKQKLNVKTR